MRNPRYRPISKNRWFDLGRTRVWQAADHLLCVQSRFFTEQYTRLYWMDMQTISLFQLHPPSALMTVFEALCAGALLASLLLWRGPLALIAAVVFAAAYALWRITRPQWACQINTRNSSRQFPLAGHLNACRRAVDEFEQQALNAQGPAPESQADATVPRALSGQKNRRQPSMTVHVLAFVMGVASAWSAVIFGFYCALLVAAYFVQQDFRFPFAVRSAAVMSQILAAVQVAFWFFALARPPLMRPFTEVYTFEHWQFALPRILFSLYGMAAVFWGSQEQPKRERNSSTVLGLS